MEGVYNFYNLFLELFPSSIQGVISFILVILIVIGIYKIIKKDFIWIIVLIVLLPGSVPILSKLWSSIIDLINYLLHRSSI